MYNRKEMSQAMQKISYGKKLIERPGHLSPGTMVVVSLITVASVR